MYDVARDFEARDKVRKLREETCFPIINRGKLWYDYLTVEQYNELNDWYRAWLDAPETGVIPPMPSWINNKIENEEVLI